MNNKEKAKAFDSIQLVNKFNSLYPVGSTVMLRKCSVESFPYNPYEVKSEAFIANDNCAYAFFKGISGYFSIDEDFIKYPD